MREEEGRFRVRRRMTRAKRKEAKRATDARPRTLDHDAPLSLSLSLSISSFSLLFSSSSDYPREASHYHLRFSPLCFPTGMRATFWSRASLENVQDLLFGKLRAELVSGAKLFAFLVFSHVSQCVEAD
jgi:hypothetical protein